MKSTSVATALSIVSMFGCIMLAFPSALIGVVARATDWSAVAGFNKSILANEGNAVMPMVLRYLTPQWVSFVGESNRIDRRFELTNLDRTNSKIHFAIDQASEQSRQQ